VIDQFLIPLIDILNYTPDPKASLSIVLCCMWFIAETVITLQQTLLREADGNAVCKTVSPIKEGEEALSLSVCVCE
jgi:hypothetical protein